MFQYLRKNFLGFVLLSSSQRTSKHKLIDVVTCPQKISVQADLHFSILLNLLIFFFRRELISEKLIKYRQELDIFSSWNPTKPSWCNRQRRKKVHDFLNPWKNKSKRRMKIHVIRTTKLKFTFFSNTLRIFAAPLWNMYRAPQWSENFVN